MATVDRSLPVVIEGARELRKALNQYGDDAINDLKAAHLENANLVAGTAKTLVPVRTGNLRDTIRAAGTKTGGRVRAGFKKVPYAGPIHFGWASRYIKPQPFLYDALDQRRGEVIENYAQQLERIQRKYDI